MLQTLTDSSGQVWYVKDGVLRRAVVILDQVLPAATITSEDLFPQRRPKAVV